MTAEVLSLPRGTSPAPLVPANIDVSAADIMAHDIKHLQKRSARMTAEHFGVWWRLHIASHLEEVTGTLPNDDVDLAIAAGFLAEGVERWRAMKDKVLEDWLLCSDGRWHHPSRARNVLHIWIGGLERDRRGMSGNTGKSAKARACVAALEDQIEFGRDALARIDSRDRFLLGLDERISKWPSKADAPKALTVAHDTTATGSTDAPYCGSDGNPEARITTATVTLKETKRSEVNGTDSSSLLCRDDSSDRQDEPSFEIEKEGSSAKRTIRTDSVSPWPPGWFEIFRSRYPKRDTGQAWGRAEKALDRIRRAGKVPFEDILDGIDWMLGRLASGHLKPQYTPLASTWLNDRGWEDRLAPKTGHSTSPADCPPSPRAGAEPSITQRAAMRAAERLGLLDEPRPRG